jgi:protein arginine kinase activator
MKCQKCGMMEANFHYSSNINGAVTEANLCSQCAQDEGYNMNININNLFNADEMFGNDGYMSMLMPGMLMMGLSPANHRIMRSLIGTPNMLASGMHAPNQIAPNNHTNCNCDCESAPVSNYSTITDDTMTKHRELNRELQMAIQNEDYEKAAELRDEIKLTYGSTEP